MLSNNNAYAMLPVSNMDEAKKILFGNSRFRGNRLRPHRWRCILQNRGN